MDKQNIKKFFIEAMNECLNYKPINDCEHCPFYDAYWQETQCILDSGRYHMFLWCKF